LLFQSAQNLREVRRTNFRRSPRARRERGQAQFRLFIHLYVFGYMFLAFVFCNVIPFILRTLLLTANDCRTFL
jgi:hypothetical protein